MVYSIILGIVLFVGFIALLAYGIYHTYKANTDPERPRDIYGRALPFDEEQMAQTKQRHKKIGILGWSLSGVCLVLFILLPWCFKTVNTGEVAVVKHLGKITEVDHPGIHFRFWMVDSYEWYDTKVRSTEVTTPAYSNDKQTMDIVMNVQYQVMADKVIDIATNYGKLAVLEERINSVTIERAKSVLSTKTADTIISDRNTVSVEVSEAVEKKLREYNIEITNISLVNIDFSDAYENSVEQSMIAKQEVEKAKAEAEKKLVEAQNKIAIAEAEANAKKAAAQGEAEAKKIQAEADAAALKLVQEAWDSITPEVREIMLKEMGLEKWDGKLPETMVGSDFIENLLGVLKPTPSV